MTKISDLIKFLEELKSKEGDIPVSIDTRRYHDAEDLRYHDGLILN